MRSTMLMEHSKDPRVDLHEKLDAALANIDLLHNQILVATYVRPQKTAGGIIVPDQTRKEDEYQGKVGLVMKKGPLAFQDDDRVKFHGQDVKLDDWVIFRASDGWQLILHGVHCRILADVDIKATVAQPDLVY